MRWKSSLLVMALIVGGGDVGHAEEMNPFNELKHNLFAGKRTTSVLRLDKCEQNAGETIKSKNIDGGFVIDAFMSLREPQQAIVYSNTHQTVAMDGKPIFEFIRYRVLPDKTATVSMKIFSAKTHEEIGKGETFKCELGEGLSFAYQPSNWRW